MTDNTPSSVRIYSWIVPILIGIFSLLGLCLILGSNWLPSQAPQVAPSRTVIPFKYQLLATETLTPTPAAEMPDSRVAPTGTSTVTKPELETTPSLSQTEQNGTLTEGLDTPTPTITLDPIFGNDAPLLAGIYDESDVGFTYIGIWDTEENVDAYLETVAVSETVGNYVAFSFEGYQIGLGYQSSIGAGEITINIDGSELTITQQAGSSWYSEAFESGTHYVIIKHTGAGPVNMDYVEIIE